MRLITLILLMLSFGFCASSQNLLILTKTGHYRHASLPDAIKAFVEMSEENGWKSTFTEDSSFFTKEILAKYDVVVFLLTNKNILSDEQKKAFKNFIQSGGGFVGVHSATVTEMEWFWYGQLIGARFIGHSGVQKGRIVIENKEHASTQHIEANTLIWEDEWYSLDHSPREDVNVLISLDETSIETKEFQNKSMAMGDHPIAWYHHFDGGRIFQTQLGHRSELYQDPIFRKHLIGGIHWASGLSN
ncbi:ThuA domain-containing protein [Seonamhaeicola sediminis]|uniref:ThuA domain-containing protein n=1 Tax=Seonamhaeicola sediminis TaxID=2528206 RepID=A0A562YIK0_9FLAO|nr:ThuA domain-containing protein [Seonamhaeicola sediminis]TWO34509.1 ThuA domain-containing protein [Seonamhaeicola sediminis]